MLKKFFLSAYFFSFVAIAQHQTLDKKNKVKDPGTGESFLIIPFHPKLYNSQLDYYLNKESGKTSRQLAEYFRDAVNEQVFQILKKRKFSVVDLMSDTVKYRKELQSIYRNSYLEYMQVPDQKKYQPPRKEAKSKGIKDGQVMVEPDLKPRFMNAKITDPRLIPSLYARFRTTYFIFINQLDLFSGAFREGEIQRDLESEKRRFVLHYTVYTLDAREINSGIVERIVAPENYSLSKIVKQILRPMCEELVSNIENQLQRKE